MVDQVLLIIRSKNRQLLMRFIFVSLFVIPSIGLAGFRVSVLFGCIILSALLLLISFRSIPVIRKRINERNELVRRIIDIVIHNTNVDFDIEDLTELLAKATLYLDKLELEIFNLDRTLICDNYEFEGIDHIKEGPLYLGIKLLWLKEYLKAGSVSMNCHINAQGNISKTEFFSIDRKTLHHLISSSL